MQANPLAPPPLQPLQDNSNPLTAATPTPADAYTANMQAYQQWAAQQRADGIAKGLLDPQTGLPTQAGMADAGQQYANALIGSRARLMAQYVPVAMRIGTPAP